MILLTLTSLLWLLYSLERLLTDLLGSFPWRLQVFMKCLNLFRTCLSAPKLLHLQYLLNLNMSKWINTLIFESTSFYFLWPFILCLYFNDTTHETIPFRVSLLSNRVLSVLHNKKKWTVPYRRRTIFNRTVSSNRTLSIV